MEFVEADCVAPAGDGSGGFVWLVARHFRGRVGGHGDQDYRCRFRVSRVGVAPPKHGFHASGQAQASPWLLPGPPRTRVVVQERISLARPPVWGTSWWLGEYGNRCVMGDKKRRGSPPPCH